MIIEVRDKHHPSETGDEQPVLPPTFSPPFYHRETFRFLLKINELLVLICTSIKNERPLTTIAQPIMI